MNILVRNLAETITKEKLMKLFQPFGAVRAVSIVTDLATGRSRGFGFVEMPDQVEAETAIKTLHHTKVVGLKIRVKEAKPQFGPDYFAQQAQQVPEGSEQPATALDRIEIPATGGGEQGDAQRQDGRPFARYSPREGARREFHHRGERRYGGRGAEERGAFRRTRYPSAPGEKREFQPRGGHGYRPRGPEEGSRRPFRSPGEGRYGAPRTGERGTPPYARHPSAPGEKREFRPRSGQGTRPHWPEEGNRRPFRPRGEGRYGAPRTGERGTPPYARHPSAPGEKREFRPRGGEGYRPRRPEEGSRRPFRPRGEGQFAPRTGERGTPSYARHPSAPGEKREFRPRGGEGYRPRRPEEGSRRPFRPRGEGQFAPRTGERGAPSRYPSAPGAKREFRPRGGQGLRPYRPGEGGARPAERGTQPHARHGGWERSEKKFRPRPTRPRFK